jgi:hypothetical protein
MNGAEVGLVGKQFEKKNINVLLMQNTVFFCDFEA